MIFQTLFGERFRVLTSNRELRDFVAGNYRAARTGKISPFADIHVEIHKDAFPLRRWQDFSNQRLQLLALPGKALVISSFHGEPWQVRIQAFGALTARYVYYYLVEPVILNLLARRDTVPWHASALVHRGSALLLSGKSGSGKSTTSLALLSAGLQLMADDEVYLRREGTTVTAAGEERAVHVDDRALKLLGSHGTPDLYPRRKKGARFKRRVEITGTARKPARVRALVFPKVDPDAPTTFRALSSTEALLRCLWEPPKEYPQLLADRLALRARFDVFTALVREARCYELTLGARPERAHRWLAELL